MKSEPMTEAQLQIQDALTDIVLNHSIEDLLKMTARVCRMGALLHAKANDHGRAGDLSHYATTIDGLFEK